MTEFRFDPIGIVHNSVAGPLDDIWAHIVSRIELDARFRPDALQGLTDFSHVEIVFLFHKVSPESIVTGARHPRGRADWPLTGIFAQRAKNRPNRIGITTCRLVSSSGTQIEVEGLDAIDQTPVLDIRPYMREFAPRDAVHQPKWATELMAGYWDVIHREATHGEHVGQ